MSDENAVHQVLDAIESVVRDSGQVLTDREVHTKLAEMFPGVEVSMSSVATRLAHLARNGSLNHARTATASGYTARV